MKSQPSFTKPRKPSLYLREIVGDSMLATLRPGQLVLFVAPRRLRVGDIVMVRHQGREKIKRVARLAGHRLYVLGDNPVASTDSRQFGWLEQAMVRGVLVWPRRQTSSFIE